ncbi:ABC transporter permease [Pigmentiphaga soli]|uniref:ABC transporter permease n=1 Tax=Pigmentiphaga soli TaxID=1007095 RepID=A0ABP8HA59_9BURK
MTAAARTAPPVSAIGAAASGVRWEWVMLPSLLVSLALLAVSQFVFLKGSFLRDLGMGQSGDTFEWHNYAQLFSDGFYLDTLRRSVGASLAATALTLALAFPTAYIIARMKSRWGLALLAAVVVSSFVSIVVKVLGLILIFSANGPFNKLLLGLGLADQPVTLLGTMTGVVIGLTHYSLGFAVLLFYSVVITIPRSLEEAALGLGASRAGVFRQVVLPLALPGLLSGALVIFNVSVGGFTSTALIGAGKVLTVPVVIQRTMLLETNYGMAAALAALLLVTVLAINLASVAAVSRMRKGVMA